MVRSFGRASVVKSRIVSLSGKTKGIIVEQKPWDWCRLRGLRNEGGR